MEAVTESEIRASFVNCSKGDAKRLPVPRDLDDQPWDDLDFLGWSDPSFAGRCYLVFPTDDRLIGIALRHESNASVRAQMCSICTTTHSRGGVALMTARKVGESGRRGNTVGIHICADLACSLYARRKKTPSLGNQYREDLNAEERSERVRDNLAAFIARLGD